MTSVAWALELVAELRPHVPDEYRLGLDLMVARLRRSRNQVCGRGDRKCLLRLRELTPKRQAERTFSQASMPEHLVALARRSQARCH